MTLPSSTVSRRHARRRLLLAAGLVLALVAVLFLLLRALLNGTSAVATDPVEAAALVQEVAPAVAAPAGVPVNRAVIQDFAEEPAAPAAFDRSTFAGTDPLATESLALGDVDGDGDLDLAAAGEGDAARLFLNDGGLFQPAPTWVSPDLDEFTTAVAWGDVDGDGDLDLAVGNEFSNACADNPACTGVNRVYRNSGGTLEKEPVWESEERAATTGVAWGDVNGDGWLDLVVGNRGRSLELEEFDVLGGEYEGEENHIYLNRGDGTLSPSAGWTSAEADETNGVALGDMDGDGDLDLAVANSNGPSRVYENDGDGPARTAGWDTGFDDSTFSSSVAWGDANGDGLLDLAVANFGCGLNCDELEEFSRVYWNSAGGLDTFDYWEPDDSVQATAALWADFNSDGALDLALSTLEDETNRIYFFDRTTLELATQPGWQSIDVDTTAALAAGDVNGDAVPDLLAGNFDQRDRVYLNLGFSLDGAPFWSAADVSFAAADALAWGDLDGDGDLDLAAAAGAELRVFRNDGVDEENRPVLERGPALPNENGTRWQDVAWGDADGDGRLELVAVGSRGMGEDPDIEADLDFSAPPMPSTTDVVLFRSEDGSADPALLPAWRGVLSASNGLAVAWADLNGDDALDLYVGVMPDCLAWDAAALSCDEYTPQSDAVFLNTGTPALFSAEPAWRCIDGELCDEFTQSVAPGDLDGDGDLDLILGGPTGARLLRNDSSAGLRFTQTWSTTSDLDVGVRSAALGDIDGDGDLDLAVGTIAANQVYRNDGGRLTAQPVWISPDSEEAGSVALGDVDGDGDLDLAVAHTFVPAVVYRNRGGQLSAAPNDRWQAPEQLEQVAWADVDGDGDLDLTGSEFVGLVVAYRNVRHDVPGLANHSPALRVEHPRSGAGAGGYAFGGALEETLIPITYALFDAERDPVARVAGFFSLDGGGSWLPAFPTTDTVTTGLSTAPLAEGAGPENEHVFVWDTFASGFYGRSDNVVFMLAAYESAVASPEPLTGTLTYPNSSGTAGRAAAVTATTPPFAAQGTQVRVQDQNGVPLAGARVFRLPAGQTASAALMPDPAAPLLTTDSGLLPGGGVVNLGDGLVALIPYTPTTPIDFTDQARYFLTSAPPTGTGLQLTSVDAPGLVTLTIVTDTTGADYHPLLLFDLTVSTEWDATDDPLFMQQLEDAVQQASALLYDVSNGQVALGRVFIYPSKAYWDSADVVVYANNSLRPSAAIGGVTQRPLPETVLGAGGGTEEVADAYLRGQIRMGTVWNPYGEQAVELSDDWWQALAHELAHYLLFLPDNYLGFVDGAYSRVNCQGSFMTSTYDPDYSEFLTQVEWEADPDCLRTLASATTGRTDWETITTFYPLLRPPAPDEVPFDGPTVLPLEVTTVWPTAFANRRAPLPARTFDIRGADNERLRLPNAQVYLFQTQGTADPTDDVALLLGNPTGGGDRIRVRGAYAGDRLCLFDDTAGNRYAGCIEALEATDVALRVSPAPAGWQPEIAVSALTSRTMQVTVTQRAAAPPLRVQLYPAHYGSAPCLTRLAPVAEMIPGDEVFTATVSMRAPAYDLTVRVWTPEDTGRESLSSFLVSWPAVHGGEPVSPTTTVAPECEFPGHMPGPLTYIALGGPSANPIGGPSANPIGGPSANPIGGPSANPIGGPSANPIGGPSANPIGGPSANPIGGPSANPIGGPSANPIGGPSANPIGGPSANPVGGAQARVLGAPFWSTDAQVVIYNEAGFFAENGVSGLQQLSALPDLAPWLLPVGQAYYVTSREGFTDTRAISFSYLQRDVPPGYEHTLTIYFRPDGGAWTALETRRFVENLVVAPLQEEPGAYGVMATVALPEMRAGWNLFAYPLPDARPAAVALASLGDRVERVVPFNPEAADPFAPPAGAAAPPAALQLQFGRLYWVLLTEGDPIIPYLAPPRRGPDGEFISVPNG